MKDDFYRAGAKLTETLILWAGLTPETRLLDIGCGPGRAAIGIGNRFGWQNDYVGLDVIALDVDDCTESIGAAHPNFSFRHLDVFNGHYNPKGRIDPSEVTFPMGDGSVDLAFAFSLFTHMFAAETERYIQEAARTLKPGGTMLSTWFLIDDTAQQGIDAGHAAFSFAHTRPDGTRIEKPLKPEDCLSHPLDAARRMFSDAGLTVVAFHRGGWSGVLPRSAVRHRQDTLVCVKS